MPPDYTWKCQEEPCAHEFSLIQTMAEGDEFKKSGVCVKCGGSEGKLKRLIKGTQFNLAGGGWYKQGYDKGSH